MNFEEALFALLYSREREVKIKRDKTPKVVIESYERAERFVRRAHIEVKYQHWSADIRRGDHMLRVLTIGEGLKTYRVRVVNTKSGDILGEEVHIGVTKEEARRIGNKMKMKILVEGKIDESGDEV